MLLRPRQRLFVERSVRALGEHSNTLGVAPTGAGKTIMLSAVAGELVGDAGAKACVLAHRDELIEQNRAKFGRVNPAISHSVVDAKEKSWAGQVTFAMVPTLARPANLDAMPALDLLVIDEAHHAAADTYRRIIDRARERNPDLKLYGVTATPNRGDRKGLREVFSNVADQIRIGELVAAGHLVPPRTFVIDVGVQEQLSKVRRTADDFDMAEVDAIMNRSPVTDAVIRHWREKAGDRQTVVFCSTVDHASNVAAAFNDAGIGAALVTGEMPDEGAALGAGALRRGRLPGRRQRRGADRGLGPSADQLRRPAPAQLVQVHDDPDGRSRPAHRRSAGASGHRQDRLHRPRLRHVVAAARLAGAGRRSDRPRSGRRGADQDLSGLWRHRAARRSGVSAVRIPVRGGRRRGRRVSSADFAMTEIDLLKRSSFQWCDLFGDDAALVANGFNAWGGAFFLNGRWYAVGGGRGQQPAPARHRRAHHLPRRRRRLAERERDRRERAQDAILAATSRRPRSSSPICRRNTGRISGSPAIRRRRC